MGKRKKEKEDYIKNKIRRLEKKLTKLSRNESQDNSEDSTRSLTPPPAQREKEGPSGPSVEKDSNNTEDENLPEEYLLALGKEGEVIEEVGDPIRIELAVRWTKIMCDGLGKEAKDAITQKYPTPGNFTQAVAPKMNPEIMASLSEISLKRDKRIVNRQNLMGKLMNCLGKSLTNVLKGTINTKNLIEEINDAAKLAAEIYYQDSASRKFFALAGANKTVQEAVKNTKTEEFLFGNNCADKIKAAQAIQKTGSQIRSIDNPTAKKTSKPVIAVKKQVNWKGPPQYKPPQHQRARGGHQQQQQHQQAAYRTQTRFDPPRQQDRKRPPVRSRPRYYR